MRSFLNLEVVLLTGLFGHSKETFELVLVHDEVVCSLDFLEKGSSSHFVLLIQAHSRRWGFVSFHEFLVNVAEELEDCEEDQIDDCPCEAKVDIEPGLAYTSKEAHKEEDENSERGAEEEGSDDDLS